MLMLKKRFSKGYSVNCSNRLYEITEVFLDTITSYRIRFSPDRYIETNETNP